MLILGFYSEFYRKEAILGKFWVVSKYKILKIIPKVRVNTLEVEKITLERFNTLGSTTVKQLYDKIKYIPS